MPPRKPANGTSPTPPNVARLTPDEQISYLFHQYEGFADWRIQVDKRLQDTEEATQRLSEQVGALGTQIEAVGEKVDKRMNENQLIMQQILIAVQGQRIPGLEVPGLTDKYTQLESRLSAFETKTDERISPIEKLRARIGYGLIGGAAVLGYSGWAIWDKLAKLLPLLTK